MTPRVRRMYFIGCSSSKDPYILPRPNQPCSTLSKIPLRGKAESNIAGRYSTHFAKRDRPPAKLFGPVTMYQDMSQLLVDNPINRYLINAPSLPEPPAALKCSSKRLRPDDHTPSRQAANVSIRDLQLRSFLERSSWSAVEWTGRFSSVWFFKPNRPTWPLRTGLSLDFQLN